MKYLPVVILLMVAALVSTVTGCQGEARYDARLTVADSLLASDPDSALALIKTLAPADFATDGDRAYRDLLLTQARYKCYITATSDSDINRALGYYRAHSGDQEKLTRAYIYKGAVMEELGHPDSAMLYYKHAEATAAPDDYFNLGYVNLRIADLFLRESSEDSSIVIRLNQAISYYETLQDTFFLVSALGKLGSMVGYSHPDSAKHYLWRAIELSCQFDSTLQYSHESTLAGVYLFQKEYTQANALAMDVLRHGSEYSFETRFYYYAAMSYIKLGKLDSAMYVMSVMPEPEDAVDSLTYYNLVSEISKIDGNTKNYAENVSNSKKLLGDILYTSCEKELLKIESDFDKQRQKLENAAAKKRNMWFLLTGLVLLIILSLLTFWMWYENKSFRHEKEAMTTELEQAMIQMKDLKSNASDTSVSRLVGLRLSAIQELYNSIKMKIDDDNRKRKVITLSSLIKSIHERRDFLELKLKNSFWEKIRLSVDGEYNGIYTYVKTRYPNLTQRELNYFCLLCSGISPQLIMMCMNVTNAKTVTNYRTQIMKKLGLDMTFDEFIKNYMAIQSK